MPPLLAALDHLTRAIGATPATAVSILIGLLLAFFGRKLFWIFVAGMGFLAGLQFAPTLVPNQPAWIILLIGIGLGLIGALLSIFLQRLAVAIAGGYAGGLLALRLATEFGGGVEPSMTWIIFIIGAVLAAIIVSLLYDWALILLTALTGALLVTEGLTFPANTELLIAAILLIFGAIVQSRSLVRPSSSAA